MESDDDHFRRRAYHEAGHIVVARKYGRRVGSVTVPRGDRNGGEARIDIARLEALKKAGPPFTDNEENYLREEMIIRAAGRGAEMTVLGNASQESGHDMACLADAALLLGLPLTNTFELELAALEEFNAPTLRAQLERMANAIMVRESLTEAEILQLMAADNQP